MEPGGGCILKLKQYMALMQMRAVHGPPEQFLFLKATLVHTHASWLPWQDKQLSAEPKFRMHLTLSPCRL